MPESNAQEGAAANGDQSQQQMQMYIPPDLDYQYRDLFNLIAGPEEVVLEFGNRHKSLQGRATIANRIVLSPQNAIRLHQTLGNAMQRLQQEMRERQQGQGEGAPGGNA